MSSAMRFTPGEFKYNGRAALALVPVLALGAALGGRATAAVLAVGAMLLYLLDAMSLREGALSAVRVHACMHAASLCLSAAVQRRGQGRGHGGRAEE